MIWLALIIPIAFAVWAFIFQRKNIAFWEPFVPLLAVLLLIILFRWIGYKSVTSCMEFLNDHVVKIEHYDDWDEWVTETCTRSVACGTDSKGNTQYCTETYDCSHSVYHPDEYYKILSSTKEVSISSSEYLRLVSKFGTGETFVDMNRDYYTKDGDLNVSSWNGSFETVETYHWSQNYENRVRVSKDVFNFQDVSLEDKVKNKLIDYPTIKNGFVNSIIAEKGIIVNNAEQKQFDWINGHLGPKKQIHVWIILFNGSNVSRANLQEAYWRGGNKNEFTVIIGLDKDKKAKYVKIVSWTEVQLLKIEARNFIMDRNDKPLNLLEFGKFLYEDINKKWIRKQFKDFKYIDVDLPLWSTVVTLILSLIVTAGLYFWIINNQFTAEDSTGKSSNKQFNNRFHNRRFY